MKFLNLTDRFNRNITTTPNHTSSITKARLEITSTTIYTTIFTLFNIPNILMIFALFKTSKRHMKISQKLFIGLCISDIATLTCYFMTKFATKKEDNKMTVSVTGLTLLLAGNYFQFLAVQIFLLITILRYWSIVRPLSPIITSEFVLKVAVASILTSLCYPVAYLLVIEYQLVVFSNLNFERVAGSVFMILVLPIAFINSISYFHLRRNSNKGLNREDLGSNTSAVKIEEEKSRQQKLRSVNTLCIITLLYAICCFPNTIRMMSGFVVYMGDLEKFSIAVILEILYLANSSLNSIVYIVRTKNIRLFYYRLIWKCLQRNQ